MVIVIVRNYGRGDIIQPNGTKLEFGNFRPVSGRNSTRGTHLYRRPSFDAKLSRHTTGNRHLRCAGIEHKDDVSTIDVAVCEIVPGTILTEFNYGDVTVVPSADLLIGVFLTANVATEKPIQDK